MRSVARAALVEARSLAGRLRITVGERREITALGRSGVLVRRVVVEVVGIPGARWLGRIRPA
jgi:hypothetical protein